MIHGLAILIGFFAIGFTMIVFMAITAPKDEDSHLDIVIVMSVLLISYGVGWGLMAIINIFR